LTVDGPQSTKLSLNDLSTVDCGLSTVDYKFMKEYFLKLFHYNHWANELILQKIYESGTQDAEIIKIMSHIVNAQMVWFSRVSGKKELARKIWELYNLQELANASKESSRLWYFFISEMDESTLDLDISYHNSLGEPMITSCMDMVIQVLNHGTYHRGQLAKLMRQKNIDPPMTDYFIYTRQKK
jgi:uncharacterized damage-inducible protein DinB